MKKLKKNRHMHDQLQLLVAILAQWQCSVASTKALDLLHWAMCMVSYGCTAGAIKMASKVNPFFHRCFCLLMLWRLPGQYRASSCLMAAPSGFQGSPGHVTLGDAFCIAPLPLHGHWKGLQGSAFCFLLLPFLLDIIIAKDHVMVHWNKLQATLLSFTMLLGSTCCLGHHQRQWKPFQPPLSPADEPGFD